MTQLQSETEGFSLFSSFDLTAAASALGVEIETKPVVAAVEDPRTSWLDSLDDEARARLPRELRDAEFIEDLYRWVAHRSRQGKGSEAIADELSDYLGDHLMSFSSQIKKGYVSGRILRRDWIPAGKRILANEARMALDDIGENEVLLDLMDAKKAFQQVMAETNELLEAPNLSTRDRLSIVDRKILAAEKIVQAAQALSHEEDYAKKIERTSLQAQVEINHTMPVAALAELEQLRARRASIEATHVKKIEAAQNNEDVFEGEIVE